MKICLLCGANPCDCRVPITNYGWHCSNNVPEGRIRLYPRGLELEINRVSDEVKTTLYKAISKHKGMMSVHEAYAVILEEVDEFWDEVKSQTLDKEKAKKELLQISAMAQRAILDLGL